MIVEIKLPVIDKDALEYRVSHWFKNDGDRINRNEDLVEIETDLDSYVIPADENGVLQIVANEGDYLKPDDVIYNIIID